jgi:RNAse (barnase) inhibitor barstar
MTAYLRILTSTESPWLLRTTIDPSEIESELNRLATNRKCATYLLDAREMKTVNGVFREFAAALGFPDYFGFNSAAFDECLADLSWLHVNGICLAVTKANCLLRDESYDISWLLQLLNRICEEWSLPIELGEPWDRSAIPFHIVFHIASDSSERLPPELAALPSLERSR